MYDVFHLNDRTYNAKSISDFQSRYYVNFKVLHRPKTLSSLWPQIYDLMQPEIRNLASLSEFEIKIKS